MYNVFHNRCPEHIANLFKIKMETTDQTITRQADDYFIPRAKLKSIIDSPVIQAPRHYNMYKKNN